MRRAMLCAALFLIGGHATAADRLKDEVLVGRLGRSSEMVFEGVESYRAGELQKALEDDVKVVVAGHPLKPLEPFLRMIEDRIVQGYRAGGFPVATAQAFVSDSRKHLVVRVAEGKRFRCGKVVVRGQKELSHEGLLESLIQPPDEPLKKSQSRSNQAWSATLGTNTSFRPLPLAPKTWCPDKPVDFSEASQKRWDDAVRRACQLQGFFSPKFWISVQPDSDTQLAALNVTFDDEGPIATLREVKFVGLEINSREDMLTFLELQPGGPARGITKELLEQRLKQSGRFVKHNVQLGRVKDEPNAIRLGIEVRELLSAPKVSEPLSRELQTVLKVPAWFEHWPEQTEDIAIRFLKPPDKDGDEQSKGFSMAGALSPARGLVLLAHTIDKQQQMTPEFALIFSPDRLAVWSPMQNQKFDVYGDDPRSEWFRRVIMKLSLKAWGANQPNETKKTGVSFGLGFKNRTRPQQPAIDFDVKFAVVTAIGFLLSEKWQAKWIDHSLVITKGESRCRIDETTGQPIEIQITNESVGLVQLDSGEGLFDRGMQEFEHKSKAAANVYDPQAPWHSFSHFAIPWSVRAWRELEQLQQKSDSSITSVSGTRKAFDWMVNKLKGNSAGSAARQAEAVRVRAYENLAKVLSVGTRSLLEEDWLNTREPLDDRPRFWIPVETTGSHPFQFTGSIVLSMSHQYFAEMTWPWVLCRIHAFVVLGETDEATSLASSFVQSSHIGPLAAWVAARIASWSAPNWRPSLAKFGESRLSQALFRRDVDELLAEGSRLRLVAATMSKQLRLLSDDEARQVVELLIGTELLPPVRLRFQHILRDRKTTNETLIPELLDEIWLPVIRPWLEREFKTMQDGGQIRNSALSRPPQGNS